MLNFSDIDWGSDDGAGDQGLQHDFVEIPEYKKAIAETIRYVIGRKETGS